MLESLQQSVSLLKEENEKLRKSIRQHLGDNEANHLLEKENLAQAAAASTSLIASNSKDANGGSVGLTDSKEIVSVSTECLGYDGTVDAILSLPDPKTDDETLTLNIRRIRRKPKITVNLKYPPSQDTLDETIELFAGENLRLGMLVRGVKLNDPVRLHMYVS